MLALLCIAGTILSPVFLTKENLLNVARTVSFLGFVAIGMTFVVIGGNLVDLSVESTIAAAGILVLAVMPTVGPLGAILITLGLGAVIGTINGILVGYVRGNPVMVTLGMNVVVGGLGTAFAQGGFVYDTDATFARLGRGDILGVPICVWLLVITALCFAAVLSSTTFGRWVYATGTNYPASRVAGVPVKRVIASTFVVSGVLAAAAGILLSSLLGSARTGSGVGYAFNAVTAVAIGGASLLGGSGSLPRTAAGLLVVGVLNNLMVLVGVPSDAQQLVVGIVIIVVVAGDVFIRRRAAP
jgi:ribose transport system permease protein